MSYATVADVQARVPQFSIGASSIPSSTQVQAYLDGCAAEIDSALGLWGLSVPIASPSWFLTDLLHLNAMGAAAQALLNWAPDLEPANAGGMSAAKAYWEAYQARLKLFRQGKSIPTQVSVAEADRSPRSYFSDADAIGADGTDQWGDTVSAEPVFTIGQTF